MSDRSVTARIKGFLVEHFPSARNHALGDDEHLLANGILLAGLTSRRKGGAWVDTPELSVSYSWPR